jgi:hypothetical protein
METFKAIDTNATNHDERSFKDINIKKAFSRPDSYSTVAYPYNAQQHFSQRGRVPQLVLAMAALRLNNGNTKRKEEEYEVLYPNSMATELQHTVALDEDYVFVNK